MSNSAWQRPGSDLSRRRFLGRSAAGLLGVAGSAFAFPGDSPDATGRGEALPDGSAAKGMITPEADRAIDAGLAYLNARRHVGGSFGTNPYRGNVAVTSLAALAFMAGGHQPGRGAYGRVVLEALQYVLSQENVAGGKPGFLHNPHATPHGPMYGHGFGTLFLAEACGMVHDRKLREEVRQKLALAVKVILTSQNVEGGWRYNPEPRDADLSVTVCQIMALRAARNAGIAVPRNKVDACIDYVKQCQDHAVGFFRYMKQGGQQGHAFARTAAGVAALFSAGLYKGPEVELGLRYLKDRCMPGGNYTFRDHGRPDMHYFYGHYYAVQAMWTAGGAYWAEWYPAIRNELVATQQSDGSWTDQICAHYATAMACLILQVPNNYLPIMQK
jgi:hypothetical protein